VETNEPYEILYAADAACDIRQLRKSDQQKVLEGIELHLTCQPRFESKNPHQGNAAAVLESSRRLVRRSPVPEGSEESKQFRSAGGQFRWICSRTTSRDSSWTARTRLQVLQWLPRWPQYSAVGAEDDPMTVQFLQCPKENLTLFSR
jgi:hypothetical protein